MRTTFRIYAAVVVAAVGIFASCQQQAPETPGIDKLSGKELVAVTLQASMAQTKVTYAETTEKNLQPDWEKDDVVIGFDENGTPYKFAVSSVKADGSATITGEAPANCTLHLIYLYGAASSSIGTDGKLTVAYDGQAGDKTIPAVMFADGEVAFGSGNFHFHNGGAVIGINATKGVPAGSTISKITVYGDNLSAATVGLTDGKLALTAGGGTGESISTGDGFSATVSSDGKGTLAVNPVLIAVPAGAKVSKISVVVGSDNYIYTLKAPVTLAKNEYKYVQGKTFNIDRTLPGLFSVSDDKKVYFSPGNLRYTVGTKKWSFFDNQYEFGPASYSEGHASEISLFTWGYNADQSIIPDGNHSNNVSRTSGDLTHSEDWGSQIDDGNFWRTLTLAEWQYLFSYQTYYNTKRAGKYKTAVTVCDVEWCIVLVPDECLNGYIFDSSKNVYTQEEWKDAEMGGLVCLPPAGCRQATDCNDVGNYGMYWTSSAKDNSQARSYTFGLSNPPVPSDTYRRGGYSVRLVRDPNPDPIPIGVGQEDYVSGGAL